jgi:hypothetical protein
MEDSSTQSVQLAYRPSALAKAAGVGRTKVFEDIAAGKLEARKPTPRVTIIEFAEAQRWIKTFPKRVPAANAA